MSKIRSAPQRTDAPRKDEGPSIGAALLAGAVLGLATDAVALALPRQQARQLSGAALAAAGGVCLGFAVADGRRSALLAQTGELFGFTALAALAVQRDSPGPLRCRLASARYLGRPAPPGPRTHQGALLVPAALHRLRRGRCCAAAHRPALAGVSSASASSAGVQEPAWAGRARISHPRRTTEPPMSAQNGQ